MPALSEAETAEIRRLGRSLAGKELEPDLHALARLLREWEADAATIDTVIEAMHDFIRRDNYIIAKKYGPDNPYLHLLVAGKIKEHVIEFSDVHEAHLRKRLERINTVF
ncbi:MAG: hypothetical protein ACOCZK_06335 [Planctomycetota bacterium]